MHDQPGLYLAGPLGFTEPGRRYHESVLLPAVVAAGFEPLDPWAVDQAVLDVFALPLGDPKRRDALPAANRAVGLRNAELIQHCAAVLAVLDGNDVDSGTAAEIGYAAALAKPVVGLRTDFRPSGDNEATVVNLQVEWFIEASGGGIEPALDLALTRVATALG